MRKHNIGLLLIGTTARGLLHSLLTGHTAKRVLERVECALRMIRADGKG